MFDEASKSGRGKLGRLRMETEKESRLTVLVMGDEEAGADVLRRVSKGSKAQKALSLNPFWSPLPNLHLKLDGLASSSIRGLLFLIVCAAYFFLLTRDNAEDCGLCPQDTAFHTRAYCIYMDLS